MKNKYKIEVSLEKRIEEASRIIRKYPNRIPVIVQSISKDLKLKRHKYLVCNDITFTQFILILRKNMENELKPEDAVFFFTDKDTLINGSLTFLEIYNMYKDKEDAFLYIHINKEETFG